MNNNIFDLKRKLAFVAALAFMGNTVCSVPRSSAKAAPAVLAEPDTADSNAEESEDTPPAEDADDDGDDTPADEPQPASDNEAEGNEDGENDVTYQIVINGDEIDENLFSWIAGTVFGGDAPEHTFDPETSSGSVTVSPDKAPLHNDIYPASGDRKYAFVSDEENVLVFDTYYRINGSFNDDKIAMTCLIDGEANDIVGGFCKSGSVVEISPTVDYVLDNDTAPILLDVNRSYYISRKNFSAEGYELKIGDETHTVSLRKFRINAAPNQFEVYFKGRKTDEREFSWKEVSDLYLKADKKQAVYISCGDARQIIHIINDRFNGNTIALNSVIRSMPHAEIDIKGIDSFVTAKATFGEGKDSFEKTYTIPVVGNEDSVGYHMNIPCLADNGYCLSGYKYSDTLGTVNVGSLYSVLTGDKKSVEVTYNYEKSEIKLFYKKLAEGENTYLFEPAPDLIERGENCFAIGTRDGSAKLMDFTPLFDGNTVIYDRFSGEELKKKTGTFSVSGSESEFSATLDNGENSDYFFVKNIISEGSDDSVSDALSDAVCFYYDRTAPKVRLFRSGNEGRWVGSEGISFGIEVTDKEKCPITERDDLSFDEREIVDVYKNYINKESADRREIYSVIIGDYRFDRPARGWTDTENIKGYVETDNMRDALETAAVVLNDLDLSAVSSKYSGQLNYDGYYRTLLREHADELLSDITAYYDTLISNDEENNEGAGKADIAAECRKYTNAVKAYIEAAKAPARKSKCAPTMTFDGASKEFKVSVKAEEEYAQSVINEDLEIFALDNSCNSSRSDSDKKLITVMIDGSKPVITGNSLKVDHAEMITDAQGAVAYILRNGTTISALITDIEAGNEGSGVDSAEISIGDISGRMEHFEDKFQFSILADAIRGKNIKTFIQIFAKDNVGNPSEIKSTDPSAGGYSVIIDSTAPKCSVSEASAESAAYSKNAGGRKQNWYSSYSDLKFSLAAEDQLADICSGLKEIRIKINGEEHRVGVSSHGLKTPALSEGKYSIGFEGIPESDKFKAYLLCEENSSIIPLGNEFARNDDGSINVELSAADYAENVSVSSSGSAYVDLSVPVVASVSAGNIPLLNEKGDFRYAYFARGSADVRISVDDHSPSAGVKDIKVLLINSDGTVNSTEPVKRRIEDTDQWEITVPDKFKGTMKVKAVSNVGRESETVDTYAVIVENGDDHRANSHIELELPETPYKDKNGNPLYSDDITAKLTVKENFSGISDVNISASGAPDKYINITDGEISGDEAEQWKVAESSRDHNIIGELTRELKLTGNSNGGSVYVSFGDNAGNPDSGIAVRRSYSIDKTDPVLNVAFTDGANSSDSQFKQIFKSDRKAVITITERNFDESLADIRVNGAKKELEWKLISGTAGTDGATYQAEVAFEKDGTYSLTANCTDMCGRKAKEYKSDEFVIDKTAPAMNIGFDKGIANDHYYNEPTTATFRISDDNFDPSRVVMTGTFNDSTEDFPKASEWTKSGSDYVSTVKFEKDGEYTVNITGKDKAGNTLEAYNAKFCIDSQKPNISVSAVGATNNGSEIRPHIQFNDANLDKDSIKIKLEGANRGKSLEFEGELRESSDGYEYVFNNIPDKADYDDIYTIKASAKDNAENKVEKDFRFSVNRYGSTFMLDEGTGEIAGQYISKAQDIVISEVNADKHSEPYNVYITKDSEVKVLKDNVDYRVEYSGGDDEWNEYKYIIFAKNFEKDGRYTVSIHSVDEAGNINISTSEKKNSSLEFCIDTTQPLCIPLNVTDNSAYKGEKLYARMEISDNIMLKDAKVYLDGKEIRSRYLNDEYLEFVVPNSKHSQNVRVVLTDMAGNSIEYSYRNILVTTNAIRILAHKTWFRFACGGAVLLAGAAVFFMRKRRRRLL